MIVDDYYGIEVALFRFISILRFSIPFTTNQPQFFVQYRAGRVPARSGKVGFDVGISTFCPHGGQNSRVCW